MAFVLPSVESPGAPTPENPNLLQAMDPEILIPLFGIFFVIGVPVMSLAARFVLRPLIKDLTEAVRGVKGRERTDFEARLGRIEEQIVEQGQRLDRLVEAELFRRRLESGAATREDSPPSARPAVPLHE